MTDIVARLRAFYSDDNLTVDDSEPLMLEAADEIERLRAKYPYSELDMDMHVEAVTKDLRDEIEQLRANIMHYRERLGLS